MSVVLSTTLLLAASNVFMTFAWHAHLKNSSDRPWYIAALVSGVESSARRQVPSYIETLGNVVD